MNFEKRESRKKGKTIENIGKERELGGWDLDAASGYK